MTIYRITSLPARVVCVVAATYVVDADGTVRYE